MPLDRALLFYFVRDALAPYSEDFRIVDKENPVVINLNGVRNSVHVSYIHDSGKARDNDDEVRIQLNRRLIEKQREQQAAGDRVAFIGFFDSGDVFVAWDPRHVFSLRTRTIVSVYARQSQKVGVATHQAAVHQFMAQRLGEQSFAIALPASALGFYLENIEQFHALPTERAIVDLVAHHTEAFSDEGLGSSGEIDVEENGRREKFTFARTAYPRDPRFKKSVLEAYDQTCCVCGRQLGIVEAAHIIPHSLKDSTNHVSNGLALCIEHHRLYDDALLLPGPGWHLTFNEERAKYLQQTRQDKGLNEVSDYHGKQFVVPKDPKKRPQEKFLRRGFKLRMGS